MARPRIQLGTETLNRIEELLRAGGTGASVLADLRNRGMLGVSERTVSRRIREIRGPVVRSAPGEPRPEVSARREAAARIVEVCRCSSCEAPIDGSGKTGMCAECYARTSRRRFPSRACRTCGLATPNRTHGYCSDACRPSGAKLSAPRRKKSAAYQRADRSEVKAALLEAQGGRCAACGGDGLPRGLVLDHDHRTGKPRAMLCSGCNSSFGLMSEDPEKIRGLLAFALKIAKETGRDAG